MLSDTARAMLEAGLTCEEVRTELRGSPLGHGEPPTCSAVEDAIRHAMRAMHQESVAIQNEWNPDRYDER